MSDEQWEAAQERYRVQKAAFDRDYRAWLDGGKAGAPPPRPIPPHIPGQRVDGNKDLLR